MPKLDIRKVHRVSKTDVDEFPITIGRSSSNSLVLHDTRVSRHHCVIEILEGVARVRDLDSHVGTKVNGRKVSIAKLTNGDHIRVGPYELVYKDPNAPEMDDDAGAVHVNGIHRPSGDTDLIPFDDSDTEQREGEHAEPGEILLSTSSKRRRKDPDLVKSTPSPQHEEDMLRERLARQALEQQLQDVQSQLQAMEDQRGALEALQTQWSEERRQLVTDLQLKDEALAKERTEILEQHEADLQQQRSRVEELEHSITESEQEHASLLTQCERFQTERSTAQTRLTELQDHLAHLQHEADLARQHAHTLESDRDRAMDLERAIDDSQQERESLQSLCNQLQDDRAAAETRMAEVENLLNDLHKQVEIGRQTEETLAEERRRAAELEQRAQDAWRQQSELQLRYEQMVNERDGMSSRIRDMEATANRWRTQADAARAELTAKTEKLDQLAGLAANLQSQLEQLEAQTSEAISRSSEDIQPDDDRADVQEILYDEDTPWSAIPQSNEEESQSVAAMLKMDPGEIETRTVDSAEQANMLLGGAMPAMDKAAAVNVRNYAGPIDFLRESVDRIRALAEERDRLANVQRRTNRRRTSRNRVIAATVVRLAIVACLAWWWFMRNH